MDGKRGPGRISLSWLKNLRLYGTDKGQSRSFFRKPLCKVLITLMIANVLQQHGTKKKKKENKNKSKNKNKKEEEEFLIKIIFQILH